MATIYDVARTAGVSAATVSRVMNRRGNVDPVMVDRVQRAVSTLGYHPNGAARSLRRQVAPVWALIISDIENPHFTALVRGVEDVAQALGHSVVLCNADEDLAKERRYIDVALGERMAGVIISPASDRQTNLQPLLDRDVPVVTIDRRLRGSTVPAVLADNSAGAQAATTHLLEQGYQRVACITGPLRTSTASQRLAGYRRALRRAHRGDDRSLVRVSDYKEGGGYEATRSLMEDGPPPDALFVANSLMTMGALEYLADAGVRVRDDVGLVGFDDHAWARLVRPALTTVAQPTYDLGRTAAEILALERREGHEGPSRSTATLATSLVVRESSVRRRGR